VASCALHWHAQARSIHIANSSLIPYAKVNTNILQVYNRPSHSSMMAYHGFRSLAKKRFGRQPKHAPIPLPTFRPETGDKRKGIHSQFPSVCPSPGLPPQSDPEPGHLSQIPGPMFMPPPRRKTGGKHKKKKTNTTCHTHSKAALKKELNSSLVTHAMLSMCREPRARGARVVAVMPCACAA